MPLPTPSRLVPLCSAASLKLARSFTDTPRRWLMSLRLSAASMLDLAKAAKPAAERPAPMPMVPIRPRNLAAPASSPRMLRAAESNARGRYASHSGLRAGDAVERVPDAAVALARDVESVHAGDARHHVHAHPGVALHD